MEMLEWMESGAFDLVRTATDPGRPTARMSLAETAENPDFPRVFNPNVRSVPKVPVREPAVRSDT